MNSTVAANRSGCAILAVDYRLSPESRFPAAIEEVYGAGVWACAHTSELGVNAARIGVGGESSGANLAAAATLLARSRGGSPRRWIRGAIAIRD